MRSRSGMFGGKHIQSNSMSLYFTVLCGSLACATASEAQSRVRRYDIIKGNVRIQTSNNPAAPETFYFYERLFERNAGSLSSVTIDLPAPLPPVSMVRRYSADQWILEAGFSSKSTLDAVVPIGTYTFNCQTSGGVTEAGRLEVTADRYSNVPPIFTGATWSRLQGADPCVDHVVTMNGFVKHSLATGGYQQVDCVDNNTGAQVFGAFLPADTTFFVLAQGSLTSGHRYTIHVHYIDYIEGPVSGFAGVRPVMNFSQLAYLSFTAGVNECEPCAADFNGDGFLDFFDYSGYVACFEGAGCASGDPLVADFNADGFVDFFDYSDFVAAFEAGC